MDFEMKKFNELLKAYRVLCENAACQRSFAYSGNMTTDINNDRRIASAYIDICEYLSECGINTGFQII